MSWRSLRGWLALSIALAAGGCECSTSTVVDRDASVMDATLLDAPGGDALAPDASPDSPSVPADASDAPAGCGDGTRSGSEVCDDGNVESGDGCSADCASDETCGNGITDLDAGEACDDGDTTNGGACRGDCLSDYACGNGVRDLGAEGAPADEVCDDGNVEGGDGCSTDCASDETCGNDVVDLDAGEVCDDGNTADGDLCSGDCSRSELCGNAALDGAEECDDGGRVPGDGCGADCFREVCGNARPDPGELCDDGDADDLDGCRGNCSFTCDDAADCDDGELCNGPESCTLGGTTGSRCGSGAHAADGTFCGAAGVCLGAACVASTCGDGIVDARTEACDDANADPTDGCRNDCAFTCVLDADCADADRCTTEVCDRRDPSRPICAPGPALECVPSDACHTSACDSSVPAPASPCVEAVIDGDGDGHVRLGVGCGTDCDDGDPAVHPAATETCNGIDDDCSGVVDEGNPGSGGTCMTTTPGICAPGTFACVGGGLVCVRVVDPVTETCDGRDQDCDGAIDDGNPGGGAACTTGMPGVCGPGTTTCTGGAIACVRNVAPSTETCNTVDEDCSGVADDGPPAEMCPPPAGVATTACGAGTCGIAACSAARYDFDGAYATGCECIDTLVNTCGSPTDLGNFTVGAAITTAAASVPFVGATLAPSDWYAVTFTGAGSGRPRIDITPGSDPSYRFDVMSSCSSAAPCTRAGGPACTGTSGTATGITSWSFADDQAIPGPNAYTFRCNSWPSTVLVRVYAATRTCGTYRLTISR